MAIDVAIERKGALYGGITAVADEVRSKRRRMRKPLLDKGHEAPAVVEHEGTRLSALDGLTEEDAALCLEKSTIIECRAGDRLLKKGGVARNLFVVLDGSVEVRDGETLLAVFGPGDVFGEMAFLLERPRSQDVYAASDSRVLSLSETTLRQLIDSDAAIAAHLLLNISKMLCLRLLKEQ